VILISRVVAEDIHVESGTFFDHGQADASCANDGDRFARDLIAKEREERMPRWPPLFAHELLALPHFPREHAHHEKRELGRGFGKHVGRIRERDFVFVCVGAIDVIESDSDLRHNPQCPLPRREYFRVNRIPQRCD
jgi:hypothetical protein